MAYTLYPLQLLYVVVPFVLPCYELRLDGIANPSAAPDAAVLVVQPYVTHRQPGVPFIIAVLHNVFGVT